MHQAKKTRGCYPIYLGMILPNEKGKTHVGVAQQIADVDDAVRQQVMIPQAVLDMLGYCAGWHIV